MKLLAERTPMDYESLRLSFCLVQEGEGLSRSTTNVLRDARPDQSQI